MSLNKYYTISKCEELLGTNLKVMSEEDYNEYRLLGEIKSKIEMIKIDNNYYWHIISTEANYNVLEKI